MRKNKDFFIVEDINIGRKNSLGWVEDSFISEFGKAGGSRAQFLGLSLTEKKLKMFFILLIIGLTVLLGKSFYIQIISGRHYFALAEENRIRAKYVKAQRGVFYDDSGEVLVRNISGFSLFITPSDLPREGEARKSVLESVAAIVGLSPKEIEDKISDYRYYFQPIAVLSGIDYEKAMI